MCDGPAYNNAFNTLGVGDPVPAGENCCGSGDRFDGNKKIATKKQTISGFPEQMPTIVYVKK